MRPNSRPRLRTSPFAGANFPEGVLHGNRLGFIEVGNSGPFCVSDEDRAPFRQPVSASDTEPRRASPEDHFPADLFPADQARRSPGGQRCTSSNPQILRFSPTCFVRNRASVIKSFSKCIYIMQSDTTKRIHITHASLFLIITCAQDKVLSLRLLPILIGIKVILTPEKTLVSADILC